MPSPFPGMDPWIEDEAYFSSFHDRFLNHLCDAIGRILPEAYFTTTNMIVWCDDDQRRIPDVSLFGDEDRESFGMATATLPGLHQVAQLDTDDELQKLKYIEIRSAAEERLVTAIELLSPANKQQHKSGHEQYRQKQQEFIAGNVNLVEIDWLRAGIATTMLVADQLKAIVGYDFDYHIAVTLPRDKVTVHGAAIQLRDRLPTIGIPLDPDVAPILINMQDIFNHTYEMDRYGKRINYHKPPTPPLTAEQQSWAAELIKQAHAG